MKESPPPRAIPSPEKVAFRRHMAVLAWRALATRNAKLPPDQRRGFLLPYDHRQAEVFGRAFPLVPEEMV